MRRLPFLALGGAALLAGLWAGLVRLGWALPPLQAVWVAGHGPLMVSGFLGTVISLERAVALAPVARSRLPYAAPLLSALGGMALVMGLPAPIGPLLLSAGSLALAAIFADINRRQANWPHAVMGVGAAAWLAGNLLWWLGRPIFQVLPWWMAFLVLTIAGERLELSRVLRPPPAAMAVFVGIVAVVLAGLALSIGWFALGVRVAGVGVLALGAWLLRFDIARRTVRQTGLVRYIALCLLPGFVWLVVGGALWVIGAERFSGGFWYDAMAHSILIGYVFSMIFGHAPIILPAVTDLALPYRPIFYVHLALLHVGLALRVAGDLAAAVSWRQWGGLLNVTAIVLFLVVSAAAVIRGRRAPRSQRSDAARE
ncbi:MAG: hypothetical protein IT317_03145 [Anaerolineales bacterium]|nr:hypothetical protein [Anaerolineales bacterium]